MVLQPKGRQTPKALKTGNSLAVQWFGSVLSPRFPQGTSLGVQWLRHCTSTAGGMGSIPDWKIKIHHAACTAKKINLQKWGKPSKEQNTNDGTFIQVSCEGGTWMADVQSQCLKHLAGTAEEFALWWGHQKWGPGVTSSEFPSPSPHTQDSHPCFSDTCHHHSHLFLRAAS